MKKIARICLILLFAARTAHAVQCQMVEARGEVVVSNFTPEEAKALAIRQARYEVIEKVSGVKVAGVTLVKDMALAGEFVKSMAKGYIRSEKILRWEQDKYQPTQKDFPVTTLRVVIEACVEPALPVKDPSFRVKAELNKAAFFEGEKPALEITSNKKAYIHIFNLTADDKVWYHHEYIPQIRMPLAIEPGQKLVYPPKGIALPVSLPDGYKRGTEAFIIVATRDDTDLSMLFKVKKEMSIPEFNNGLLSIAGDIVEEMVIYSVEKR